MGASIVLIIAIIVIVVVVKINKKKKAIEELANSRAYQLALDIKEEWEKKGYSVSEDMITNPSYVDGMASGRGYVFSNFEDGRIRFSAYRDQYIFMYDEHQFRMGRSGGKRVYALKNDNIGIFIYSVEDSEGVPKFIEIAAEVIRKSGYGTSILLDS
jgi:hypothetical protein